MTFALLSYLVTKFRAESLPEFDAIEGGADYEEAVNTFVNLYSQALTLALGQRPGEVCPVQQLLWRGGSCTRELRDAGTCLDNVVWP